MKKTKYLIISACLVFSYGSLLAQVEKLGGELTLVEKTRISEILNSPENFIGKKVLVEGTILDVCEGMGCWMDISGDMPNQKVKIKVKDGDIVFPVEAKGNSALVEGVVYTIELDEEEAAEYFEHMAEDAGKEFDRSTVTGPMTLYQIKGLGAEIHYSNEKIKTESNEESQY